MAHPYYHACSSVRLFGGCPNDYLFLHNFFDQTKVCVPTSLHRLLLHNTFGIDLCCQIHGEHFQRSSDQITIQTRTIAEQHVSEDFGFLPTLQDCLRSHPLSKGNLPPGHGPFVLPHASRCATLARRLGGVAQDYAALADWFNTPALLLDNPSFFCLLGNSFGIFLAEQRFGLCIQRASDQKSLPTRYIAEQLVQQTLGDIPTLAAVFKGMTIEPWMCLGARPLSGMLDE
jgi:hypothetical protein